MKRLLISAILGLLTAPASGLSQQAIPEQGAPPTNLEQRNGFWTANEAPPEDTSNFQVHTVVAGNTLWAIANTYMNDPFLWPQLWESNAHVINPHWIYPGDIILIRPVTAISEVAPPPPPIPEAEPPAPREIQIPVLTRREDYVFLPEPVLSALPEPVSAPPVKPADLYCSGFVTTRNVGAEGASVIAQVPPGEGLLSAEGQYVYVDRGSADGVAPGDLLAVARPTRNIESPRDNVGGLGRHYLDLGQMRVVMVQPAFSLARVIHSCAEITLGDVVTDFEEIDFPELPANRPFSPFMPSSGKTTGAVAMTLDPLWVSHTPALGGARVLAGYRTGIREQGAVEGVVGGMAGEGQIVYLDLGEGDGVRMGDIFLIYRPIETGQNRLLPISGEAERLLAGQRYVVGELVVLKVEERAATALVTFSSDGVSPGDLVELR